MSGRTLITVMLVSWIVAFGLLLAIESFTAGLELSGVPALVLLSFLLSPVGWLLFWLKNRTRKRAKEDSQVPHNGQTHA